MSRILVAMSGGVDSTVTAHLMKEKYGEVEGAILSLHKDNEKDIESAKKVSDQLGIKLNIIDGREHFKNTVIKDFVTSYEKCITPNPCIYCNKNCKFELLLKWAKENGFDYVASGHYAKIEKLENGRYGIFKGKDKAKDQSYVLYQLSQEQLSKIIMPLGDYTKDEIRQIASELKLENAQAKESQDICFIPDGDYAAFIESVGVENKDSNKKGNFVDRAGNVLGEHKGLIHYTIGQRKGLGLSLKSPMYVCEKRPWSNEVVLCDNESLFKKRVIARDVNFVGMESLLMPTKVSAKVRYSQNETEAMALLVDDKLVVMFDEGVRAPAAGQSIVMYDGDLVLGGGIIN